MKVYRVLRWKVILLSSHFSFFKKKRNQNTNFFKCRKRISKTFTSFSRKNKKVKIHTYPFKNFCHKAANSCILKINFESRHVGLFAYYLEFETFPRLRKVLKFQAYTRTFESAFHVLYKETRRLVTFTNVDSHTINLFIYISLIIQ